MSVHRKDNRWIVRWREGSQQRSRSFPTKREASAFDRDVNQGRHSRPVQDLMTEVMVVLCAQMNDEQLQDAAASVNALSLTADRTDNERQFLRNMAVNMDTYREDRENYQGEAAR